MSSFEIKIKGILEFSFFDDFFISTVQKKKGESDIENWSISLHNKCNNISSFEYIVLQNISLSYNILRKHIKNIIFIYL